MITNKKCNVSILSGLLISHITISLAFIFYLVLRFPFPFYSLYKPLASSRFIIFSSIAICIPYIIFGFLYATIVNSLPKNKLKWLIWPVSFSLISLVTWFICYSEAIGGVDGSVWMLYAYVNTPGGLIVFMMSHAKDIQSPLIALSAIAPPISFFLGMVLRSYLKIPGHHRRKNNIVCL